MTAEKLVWVAVTRSRECPSKPRLQFGEVRGWITRVLRWAASTHPRTRRMTVALRGASSHDRSEIIRAYAALEAAIGDGLGSCDGARAAITEPGARSRQDIARVMR
jgi:hypothetical protein